MEQKERRRIGHASRWHLEGNQLRRRYEIHHPGGLRHKDWCEPAPRRQLQRCTRRVMGSVVARRLVAVLGRLSAGADRVPGMRVEVQRVRVGNDADMSRDGEHCHCDDDQ